MLTLESLAWADGEAEIVPHHDVEPLHDRLAGLWAKCECQTHEPGASLMADAFVAAIEQQAHVLSLSKTTLFVQLVGEGARIPQRVLD